MARAPDLQLTAVLPVAFDTPAGEGTTADLGNIELAAKYKFLHQEDFGWDVAVFPRVFLPAGSASVGERHVSLLLPLWIGRDWGHWSTFGGGGCVDQSRRGLAGLLPAWLGADAGRSSPACRSARKSITRRPTRSGGRATTGLGAGLVYDVNEHFHLMASGGPGIQNAAEADRYSWYVALLSTF